MQKQTGLEAESVTLENDFLQLKIFLKTLSNILIVIQKVHIVLKASKYKSMQSYQQAQDQYHLCGAFKTFCGTTATKMCDNKNLT